MTAPTRLSRRTLRGDLEALRLPRGGGLLVHCSMKRLGTVRRGAVALHRALRQTVGEETTLVVPTHTSNNSTTSAAYREATLGMDAEARARFEAAMEGFDPAVTASYRMGALAEHVRRQRRAVRSDHPQTSFAALGPLAELIVNEHDLDSHLGDRSPLGALYRADAWILLLGVGYNACTALHLAEYRVPRPPVRGYHCFVSRDGRREPTDFLAVHLDDTDFSALGADLDEQDFVRRGPVGGGMGRAMPMRAAVDFAEGWMTSHRRQGAHSDS